MRRNSGIAVLGSILFATFVIGGALFCAVAWLALS